MQQIVEDYPARESIKAGDFITLVAVPVADCEDGAPHGVALDSCNAGETVRVGRKGSFPVSVDLDTYYWRKRD